jgi:short-subunit dehydrogenase
MPETQRVMIVTGASSGIGRALALESARNGYRIVAIARRGERLAEVAGSIRDIGGACATLAGDVVARDMPVRIVDAALQAFGRVDVIVNNAGAGAYGALLEQSDAAIEAQWQLHVAAPLRIARAALAQLELREGQLVFLGSGIARVPLPQYGAYALAKAAIRAAATQLRRELRPRGIAVTYVDPGLVATEFHRAIGIARPNKRAAATPERIARAILRGIARRRPVVSAVGWQTAATVVGESFGSIADRAIVAAFTPRRLATEPEAPEAPSRREQFIPFERALEPVARRMERVKLSPSFLREALVPGATLELNELAMRWAGMPNKNERAVMREALDALAAGGYLEALEEEKWRVVRAVEPSTLLSQ